MTGKELAAKVGQQMATSGWGLSFLKEGDWISVKMNERCGGHSHEVTFVAYNREFDEIAVIDGDDLRIIQRYNIAYITKSLSNLTESRSSVSDILYAAEGNRY